MHLFVIYHEKRGLLLSHGTSPQEEVWEKHKPDYYDFWDRRALQGFSSEAGAKEYAGDCNGYGSIDRDDEIPRTHILCVPITEKLLEQGNKVEECCWTVPTSYVKKYLRVMDKVMNKEMKEYK